MQRRKPNPHIIKLKRGSFFDGVFFHTATKDELMAHYWGRFDVLSDGDGSYGLLAEGVLTPYATHFAAGGEHPVAFVVKGMSKLMDADGRTHWPFAEIGNYIIDDEDPHLYRRLARSVVKAISDIGCGIFGDFSVRYGVIAGDIRRNSENTNIVFSATTVPEDTNYIMLYANKPLNWFAGIRNWDMIKVGDDFYAAFIPFHELIAA